MSSKKITITKVQYFFLFLSLFLLPLGCVNYKTLKRQQQFLKAAEKGDLLQVQHFLNEGVDVEIELSNRTALSFAAGNGHLEVMEYLIKKNASIKTFGSKRSPLAWAITGKVISRNTGRHLSAIKLLLDHGADPDHKGAEITFLPGCIYAGEIEVVELLMRYGANPFSKDHQGRTAINMMNKDKYKEYRPLIEKAIKQKRWELQSPIKSPKPLMQN